MRKFLLVLVTVLITTVLLVSCQSEKSDYFDTPNADIDTESSVTPEESETEAEIEAETLLISPEDIYGTWIMLSTSPQSIEILQDNTVLLGSGTYVLEYSAGSSVGEWQQFYLRSTSSEDTSDELGDEFSAICELELSLADNGAIKLEISDMTDDETYEGCYFLDEKTDIITIDESNWEQYFEIRMESEPYYDPVSEELAMISTGWQFGLKKEYMASIADCIIEGETIGGNEAMYLVSYNLETGEYYLTEYNAEELKTMGYASLINKEEENCTFHISARRTTDFKEAATRGYVNGDKPLWMSEDGKTAFQEYFIKKDVEIITISGVLALIK